MSIYVDLRDKLYDSLAPIFPDNQVIQAYSNGPEVVTPYITYDIISIDQIGREYMSTLVPLTGQQVVSNYEVKVRVEFIGRNDSESNFQAAELATTFYFILDQTPIQENFLKNGLSYMRKDSIKRVPKKRETDWFMCHQVDLIFGYQVESRQNVDTIESVTTVGVYTKPTNTDPVVITTNI